MIEEARKYRSKVNKKRLIKAYKKVLMLRKSSNSLKITFLNGSFEQETDFNACVK